MEFIHLHNHTDYSILDGAITLDKLIAKAIEHKMPAIAMTDHGNMFGAVEFYMKAKKAGITPIIGEEFYMAPGSRFKKETSGNRQDDKPYHMLILAKNNTGYQNLMKLSSIGYTEGFYYKPRIDLDVLEKYSEGLICGSACIAGEIPRLILSGKNREARETAGKYNEIFGKDHFYLELQDHGIPEQHIVNKELIKISSELNIPLIATNDAHYANREDAYSHEVLLCIQTGKTMSDPARMKFSSDDFYLKSPEEMQLLFADYPDALYNTHKIYEMIDLELDLGNPILPVFEVPEGFNLDSYLEHLVYEGAGPRYGDPLPVHVQDRIKYELSVIIGMEFPGYFLIVWDFINHAREVGIPTGPGRGSAAGSIVSYCLGITALDPLKYDLLFERFLNPDRNEMPDMDLDFCADRREEVIDYVRSKYGADHVSQIIAFNKLKAKAVVKDVARAMDIPFARSNEISKMIEEDTLQKSINVSKDLKEFAGSDEGRELIDISLKLEGLVRSAGKHAAGVVISKGPITDYVPLYREPKEGGISSQYEKNTLEQAGLVKMDFLGLKNLTIIDKCLKLIKESAGDTVDITSIPLDDEKTFELLRKADTKGVFQLESSGMQNVLRRLGPTVFEDIIAIVALYRPGPLNSGMTEDFIERKRDNSLIDYPHDSLEPVLKDTLGVVVYQEQVMLISQVMGGFSLPEADKLRKAMGKKKIEIINALESKFLAGAEKKQIDRDLAQRTYRMIEKFAEYGFNKSHSAAYALVTYQTAYLKAHYQIQYMAALISAQPDKQSDVIQYINDCRANNIQVLPSSINSSEYDFTIEGDCIRFGFSAIKGMGEKAIEEIVHTRKENGDFKSLKDFLERVSPSTVNKGVLEALIKSGSFDAVHSNRAQLFCSVDILIDSAKQMQKDIASGQGNLFDFGANDSDSPKDENGSSLDLKQTPDWKDNERLVYEKEVLGLYISGHPLARYEKDIRSFSSVSISNLTEDSNGQDISIAGVISDFQVRRSKKGNMFASGILEDLESSVEILVFSRTLKENESLLSSDSPVMVTGKIEMEGDNPKKMIINSVRALKDVRRENVTAVHIQLDPIGVDDSVLEEIKSIFKKHRGNCSVYFHVKDREGEQVVRVHRTFNITPSEELIHELSDIIDESSIRYTVGHGG